MLRSILDSLVKHIARAFVRRERAKLSRLLNSVFDDYVPRETDQQRRNSPVIKSYLVTLSAVVLRGISIPREERLNMAHSLHDSAVGIARYLTSAASANAPAIFHAVPDSVSPKSVVYNTVELYSLIQLCAPSLGSDLRPYFKDYILATIFADSVSASVALTEIAVLLIGAANPVTYSMFYDTVVTSDMKATVLPTEVFVRRTSPNLRAL